MTLEQQRTLKLLQRTFPLMKAIPRDGWTEYVIDEHKLLGMLQFIVNNKIEQQGILEDNSIC